jgi:hypothetical protein
VVKKESRPPRGAGTSGLDEENSSLKQLNEKLFAEYSDLPLGRRDRSGQQKKDVDAVRVAFLRDVKQQSFTQISEILGLSRGLCCLRYHEYNRGSELSSSVQNCSTDSNDMETRENDKSVKTGGVCE